MSKNKKKFDLSKLVHHGYVNEGETLYFLSNPKITCTVEKHPGGEFKLKVTQEDKNFVTVHQFVQNNCFGGAEPQDHASRWLRTKNEKTLYELWQEDVDSMSEAA